MFGLPTSTLALDETEAENDIGLHMYKPDDTLNKMVHEGTLIKLRIPAYRCSPRVAIQILRASRFKIPQRPRIAQFPEARSDRRMTNPGSGHT